MCLRILCAVTAHGILVGTVWDVCYAQPSSIFRFHNEAGWGTCK